MAKIIRMGTISLTVRDSQKYVEIARLESPRASWHADGDPYEPASIVYDLYEISEAPGADGVHTLTFVSRRTA